MTQQLSLGRKIAMLGTAAALAAVMAIPAATAAQDENAMIRVLHGAGDAPAVDIYADGGLIGEGLAFGQISDYIPVAGGEYQVQVVPSGVSLEDGPIVIDATLTFDAGTMTTVAATGSLADGIIPQVIADAPAPSATPLRSASLTSATTPPRSTSRLTAETSSSLTCPTPTTRSTWRFPAARTTSRFARPAPLTWLSISPRSPFLMASATPSSRSVA